MLTMGRQENDPNYDDNAQKSLFANQLFVPYGFADSDATVLVH